ncbi:MAG: tRNA 2-thiouridine(34) synthase MnmA [Candidatus Liptonbacteria bacterium]|nr:tRNA 2-thiouridine(34) synthase MnmA [Candidatus Liptonbacteria bacterium]
MIPNSKHTVVVAMSGGVDSSVAAYLLKKRGYNVVGVYMKCYNLDGCSEQDAEDARRVAGQIGIPFYVWDFEREYKKKVVKYMIDGYRRGETPNPDVECNREIKFGLFLEKALAAGADYVATGHYVRLRSSANNELLTNKRIKKFVNSKQIRYSLIIARDKNKDQSYFLWTLTQKQLRHCLFPIGDYTKPQVRAMARRAGLSTADKKDSQGICFLGKVDVSEFLAEHLPVRTGQVVTTEGQPIGQHKGSWFYTIGQRHGLDLRIKNKELRIRGQTETKAHYVAAKNIRNNTITVAEGQDNPALFRREIVLRDVNFIHPYPYSIVLKNNRIRILARVRYRQPLARAELAPSNLPLTRGGTEGFRIVFDQPQKFVAPGQSAVFYSRKGELLGGGVIS